MASWHRTDDAGEERYLPRGGAVESAVSPPIQSLSRMFSDSSTFATESCSFHIDWFCHDEFFPMAVNLRFRRIVYPASHDGERVHEGNRLLATFSDYSCFV
jgi:hypothetical protein